MAFNLRPFGTDLLAEKMPSDKRFGRRDTDEAFKALTMLGIFFSFFIGFQGPFGHIKDMMRATTAGGYLAYIAESAIMDFLLIPGSMLLFAFFSKKASGNSDVKLKTVFVNFANCLIPIGLAVWAAFSFGILVPNGSYLLHVLSDPFAWGWNVFGTAGFPWTPVFTGAMPYLQSIAVFIGLVFALDFGFKFSLQTYATLEEAKRGWRPIAGYLVLLTIAFLYLFMG